MKKNVSFLIALILVTGGIFLSSCTWDMDPDEDQLGASRPIIGMPSDIYRYGLNETKWRWNDSTAFVSISFTATDCRFDYIYFKPSYKQATTNYKYSFKFPIATLTPVNEKERALIGTVASTGAVEDNLIKLINANDSIPLFTVKRI